MYKARGLHHQALKCLTSMALGGGTGAATEDTDSVASMGKRSNHQQTVSYLKHLSGAPFDLVTEFAEWVLKQHPRAWMSIFTAWERDLRLSVETEGKT